MKALGPWVLGATLLGLPALNAWAEVPDHLLYPTALLAPTLPTQEARVLPPGRWRVGLLASLANTEVAGRDGGLRAVLDMEIREWRLVLRRGLGKGLEAGLYLPWIQATSGWSDALIVWWHRTLGFSGRRQATHRFRYTLVKDGRAIVQQSTPVSGMGDSLVYLKRRLWRNASTAGAALLHATLPTGRARDGLGSGSWNAGGRLVVDWHPARRWRVNAAAGVNVPGPYRGPVSVNLRPVYELRAAAAYGLSPALEGFASLALTTHPLAGFRGNLNNPASSPSLQLTLGACWRTRAGTRVVLALGQDLSRTVPDVTLSLGVTFPWGSSSGPDALP